MKRFAAIFFFTIILFLLGFFFFHKKARAPSVIKKTEKTIIHETPHQTMLFVPYWTLASLDKRIYQKLIYFGITANTTGIDTAEDGYKNIGKFISLTSKNQETLLAVRLINTDVNQKLLDDPTFRQKIISQSIEIAKQYAFNGIILDLEIHAFPFDSVIKTISDFNADFYKNFKENSLSYFVSFYGDTFYRARPYDVSSFAKNSDGIFILAYDLHKANGDPGPNFPISRSVDGEYDLKQMIADFQKDVPTKKLSVVFGLFGYDWKVNDKNQAQGTATSESSLFFAGKFKNICTLTACTVRRDTLSTETTAAYNDANSSHIVWFDDMQSVKEKTAFLNTKGIFSIAFWANSYF
ncbi:MAG: glycoside hydrolase family 18 protein [Candidatus Levyibacteriota bacterium]